MQTTYLGFSAFFQDFPSALKKRHEKRHESCSLRLAYWTLDEVVQKRAMAGSQCYALVRDILYVQYSPKTVLHPGV